MWMAAGALGVHRIAFGTFYGAALISSRSNWRRSMRAAAASQDRLSENATAFSRLSPVNTDIMRRTKAIRPAPHLTIWRMRFFVTALAYRMSAVSRQRNLPILSPITKLKTAYSDDMLDVEGFAEIEYTMSSTVVRHRATSKVTAENSSVNIDFAPAEKDETSNNSGDVHLTCKKDFSFVLSSKRFRARAIKAVESKGGSALGRRRC